LKVITRARLGAGLLAGVLGVALVSSGCAEDDNAAAAKTPTTKNCSQATIRGTYAFGIQGNVKGVGPIAASGTTTFDGSGKTLIRGLMNTTTDAPAVVAELVGTYTVNPDKCTGTATYNIPPPGFFGFTQLRFEAVIVGRGKELRYLISTPGVVFAGNSVRQ
jgi:hypothetical protein